MKRTIKDLKALKGKVVLLRVDFNVPMDDSGFIQDVTRIDNEIPTIKYLSEQDARVVILSHLGRPKGFEIRKSLWPVALYLMKNLDCNISFCNTVLGEEAKERIKLLRDGQVLLLENIRFCEGEMECDKKFSKELARLGDIFVDDAFGVAHRECASNYGVARLLPNAIGFLMEKEVENLSKLLDEPKKPFVAVIGGAKVDTKIRILERFLDRADTIIIGGAMAYTFMRAQGQNIGSSMFEPNNLEDAKYILSKAEREGKKILLPIDHIVVRNSDKSGKAYITKELEGDMVGYDIGPETIKLFSKEIAKAGQVFWNGPMGMFEKSLFSRGTYAIADAMASSKAYTVVGGGDTVSAVNKVGCAKKINFISTGGGATLEFLEKGSLPALEVIQEKTT